MALMHDLNVAIPRSFKGPLDEKVMELSTFIYKKLHVVILSEETCVQLDCITNYVK